MDVEKKKKMREHAQEEDSFLFAATFFSFFSLFLHIHPTPAPSSTTTPLLIHAMSATANQRAAVILNHLSASSTHPAGLLANQVAIVTGAGYVLTFAQAGSRNEPSSNANEGERDYRHASIHRIT